MTTQLAQDILQHLAQVTRLRELQRDTSGLQPRVLLVKQYQCARFRHTYRDLLASSRHGAAARFFLDELYGPRDYSERDAQFGRIVPAIGRLFPSELLETVARLAALHALSEGLDHDMAMHLADHWAAPEDYVRAWRLVGRREDRLKQIRLTVEVGRALDRYTRTTWLRTSLRMMRGPARAAGLADLQHFLESGFDAFGQMRGAEDFLQTILLREEALASMLFNDSLNQGYEPMAGSWWCELPELELGARP